jgi:hypothetical protein
MHGCHDVVPDVTRTRHERARRDRVIPPRVDRHRVLRGKGGNELGRDRQGARGREETLATMMLISL